MTRAGKLDFESVMFIAGIGIAAFVAYGALTKKGIVREANKDVTVSQLRMGEAECRANGGIWQRGVCVSPYARKAAWGSYA